METVKERPVLMNIVSVGGILDDRKTQTRRVVKPQPKYGFIDGGSEICIKNPASAHPDVSEGKWVNCPYGKIGDRLWVRETWAVMGPAIIRYKVDGKDYFFNAMPSIGAYC